jgi:hypothetical protein
MSMGSGY